jgi:catechol 2,3-dioxygenase-like lactoylglutathione lyase family enzyme
LNAFTGSDHFHHGLYEVHLPVTDLQRSVDFYSKLGFKLGWGTAGGSSALLIYDDEGTRWMLGLFRVDTVVHRSPAEYHISFRIAEAQAVWPSKDDEAKSKGASAATPCPGDSRLR